MTLPEDRIDFALRLLHGIGRSRRNEEHVDLRLAAETLHDRGVRREDRVVLVLPHQVAALALEHSHDFERHVLDADDLADGVAVREKILSDCCAEDGDFRGRFDVGVGEEIALRDVPHADQRIVSADAVDRRAPVQFPCDDLRRGPHLRRDIGHVRRFVFQRLAVIGRQVRVAGEEPRAAGRGRAGEDHDEVRSERIDRRLNRRRCAIADCHNDDHAADANDHSEHRQKRSELVARDRLESDDGDVAEPLNGVLHDLS